MLFCKRFDLKLAIIFCDSSSDTSEALIEVTINTGVTLLQTAGNDRRLEYWFDSLEKVIRPQQRGFVSGRQ